MQTLRLLADNPGFEHATKVLGAGGLVAFPTETVYGLGADATDDRAVAGIYQAKGRPSFNPLIAHMASIDMAQHYVQWSPEAEALATAFWPGPLTMVLPLRNGCGVSRLASAGLDTLAIRIPASPVAQTLLSHFGRPVAAPSANRSGQISPTLAEHVLAGLDGRIDAIIDGGACQAGLESTIVGLAGDPRLLRPGPITLDQVERVLGRTIAEGAADAAISAPGQLLSHYAPRASVRLNAENWKQGESRLGFGNMICDLNLSAAGDLTEAAANLFAHLHSLDAARPQVIAVAPIPETGLGVAINDRLRRAAADR